MNYSTAKKTANDSTSSDLLAFSITLIIRRNPAILPAVSKFLKTHTDRELLQRLGE